MKQVGEMVRRTPESKGTRPVVLATAGVLGALAASSCCLLPLALFGIGATGAWIGALGSLAPYQPIFVAVTVGLLIAGFWSVYRKPATAASEGSYCLRPVSMRFVKGVMWAATVLVVAAAAFPYAAPLLLDV